ncbi:MAG: CoA transferase, partial [Pseudomonadota bacterium]
HPEAGHLRQTRPPARFEGSPTGHRFGAPRLGAHTREALAEAGLSTDEIAALLEAGIAVEPGR